MPVTGANPAKLQQQLQTWTQNQGIDKPLHDLSLGQMQKAARSLDVPLNDLVTLREDLVAKAADRTQAAGDQFADTLKGTQGADLSFGGHSTDASPALVHSNWDAKAPSSAKGGKGAGLGKGKGGSALDTDLAMSAMNSTRFVGKVKTDRPFVDFKGYRGGSPDVDAYFKSTYSYSDVEKVMSSFGIDNPGEAKALIGYKLKTGWTSQLDDIGVTQHPFDKHECLDAFDTSAYTMRDARRAVAELPFLHDVAEAKEYIGLKIVNGTEDILRDVGIGGRRPDDNIDLFFKGGYTYEDAEAAVNAFSFLNTIEGAKDYIGLKVANGTESILREKDISPGNFDSHEMLGAFYASGYSYDDAEKAVSAFDFLHNVSEAKEYIGLKVINGTEDIMADKGITRNEWDSHEVSGAFQRSGYTETDARAALMAFDFLDSVQDAKEYIGLKIVNNYESILSDVGISPSPYDAHEQLAAYAKAGYTNADADKAVAGWDFLSNRDEAREYIGLKVMNGAEYLLEDVGITSRDANNMYDYKTKGDACWGKGSWDGGYDAGKYGKGASYKNDWDYKK